ncbi:flavodoxin family protein [Actinomadura darangshiensis]|uniref:Flavodoxin family protein n=1 Tax=Actinomadura darangshiensis TaxID=705336 RepID=A0A4R5B4Z4_9ACTN|nr:flavodoxin family protein [Actinomadura darangshiensis]TDD80325.1 flavodoxin family protein [Actinomadura darangshiensis]
MKVLALSSSPRKDGNSRLLAQSVLDGALNRGHDTDLVDLCDVVTAPLRDCRTCRGPDGTCSIADGHHALLRDKVLAADALVLATPLYWYGISGQLKIFIDRIFCHTRADLPDSAEVKRRLMNKRAAVVVSSEESYPGVLVGVTAQMQELARYLDHDLVGVVHGIANSRGEVRRDPAGPVERAFDLGARLFDAPVTDYRMDTVRPGAVWPAPSREPAPSG